MTSTNRKQMIQSIRIFGSIVLLYLIAMVVWIGYAFVKTMFVWPS